MFEPPGEVELLGVCYYNSTKKNVIPNVRFSTWWGIVSCPEKVCLQEFFTVVLSVWGMSWSCSKSVEIGRE